MNENPFDEVLRSLLVRELPDSVIEEGVHNFLGDSEDDDDRRIAALEAAIRVEQTSTDADRTRRLCLIALVLRSFYRSRAMELLVGLLLDPCEDVRWEAHERLSDLRLDETLPAFLMQQCVRSAIEAIRKAGTSSEELDATIDIYGA